MRVEEHIIKARSFLFWQDVFICFFWVGIIISLFCVGYIIYIGTIYYFLNNYIDMPPGWATILVSILFFGSIQLMALGILGKYLILILENGKKRPEFIVKEKKTD